MKQITTTKWFLLIVALFTTTTILTAQKHTGLTATASDGTNPTIIFDGDYGSRWQDADNVDDSYLIVDLGSVKSVDAIKIYWEGANAKAYSLSFSNDDITYSGELNYTEMAANARIDVASNLGLNCRYIKMQGVTRQLPYGYSIYEFEVYPYIAPVLTTISLTPSNSSIALGASQQLTANGFDFVGNPFVLTETTQWSVDGVGATISATGLFESTEKGVYTITATNDGISNTTTVEVLPAVSNLAIGSTATATSGNGTLAIDNDKGSRWESAQEDPQAIMIDLGELNVISDIIISWEGASSKNYIIEGSEDGTDWATMLDKTDLGNGARIDRYYDLNTVARYVRLTSTARTTNWGNSIWEFQIYGEAYTPTEIKPLSPAKKAAAVYPTTPNSSIIVHSEEAVKSIIIYNLLGQVVKTEYKYQAGSTINVSNLVAGNYLVKIVTENNEIFTQQISKR